MGGVAAAIMMTEVQQTSRCTGHPVHQEIFSACLVHADWFCDSVVAHASTANQRPNDSEGDYDDDDHNDMTRVMTMATIIMFDVVARRDWTLVWMTLSPQGTCLK